MWLRVNACLACEYCGQVCALLLRGGNRALSWPHSDVEEGMDDNTLSRIADALERMAPAPLATPDFAAASGFVWHVGPDRLEPVPEINRVELDLLVGIDRSRDTLLENTRRFAAGHAANNALLWGARGMGKSSLVKAIHGALTAAHPDLKLVELPVKFSLKNLLLLEKLRPHRLSVTKPWRHLTKKQS